MATGQVREDGANAKLSIGTISPWSSQRGLYSQAHLRHLALIFHIHHRLMLCLHPLLDKAWVHSALALGVLSRLPGCLSTICFQNPLKQRCAMGRGWDGGRKWGNCATFAVRNVTWGPKGPIKRFRRRSKRDRVKWAFTKSGEGWGIGVPCHYPRGGTRLPSA